MKGLNLNSPGFQTGVWNRPENKMQLVSLIENQAIHAPQNQKLNKVRIFLKTWKK